MKKTMVLAMMLSVAALWACSSDNGNGTVRVILTDKPVDGVQKLNLTISRIEIHLVAKDAADEGEADGGANGEGDDAGDTAAKDEDRKSVV